MQIVTDSERPTPAHTPLPESPLEETVRILTARVLELEDDITRLAKPNREQPGAIATIALSLAKNIDFDTVLAHRIEALEHAVGELRHEGAS